MTQYICDRCDKRFDNSTYLTKLFMDKPETSDEYNTPLTISKDLCTTCYKALAEFLKPLVQPIQK